MILIWYRLKQLVCDVCVKLNVRILMFVWVRYAPVIGCIDRSLCKFGFVYMSTYSIDNMCVCLHRRWWMQSRPGRLQCIWGWVCEHSRWIFLPMQNWIQWRWSPLYGYDKLFTHLYIIVSKSFSNITMVTWNVSFCFWFVCNYLVWHCKTTPSNWQYSV